MAVPAAAARAKEAEAGSSDDAGRVIETELRLEAEQSYLSVGGGGWGGRTGRTRGWNAGCRLHGFQGVELHVELLAHPPAPAQPHASA